MRVDAGWFIRNQEQRSIGDPPVPRQPNGTVLRHCEPTGRLNAPRWLLAMKDETIEFVIPGSRFARPRNDERLSAHPEEIALADFHAVVAQNAVGGGGMEVEVREGEA